MYVRKSWWDESWEGGESALGPRFQSCQRDFSATRSHMIFAYPARACLATERRLQSLMICATLQVNAKMLLYNFLCVSAY